MHTITKDGYSTVLKTTVEHSPAFWRMIDQLFALDALIDLRDPTAATMETEFEAASVHAQCAIADYANSVAPGCAGSLRNALYSHLDRIAEDEAEKADSAWLTNDQVAEIVRRSA